MRFNLSNPKKMHCFTLFLVLSLSLLATTALALPDSFLRGSAPITLYGPSSPNGIEGTFTYNDETLYPESFVSTDGALYFSNCYYSGAGVHCETTSSGDMQAAPLNIDDYQAWLDANGIQATVPTGEDHHDETAQPTTEESLRAAAQTTVRLLSGRVSAILAPRPGFSKSAENEHMQGVSQAMTALGGSPDGLAVAALMNNVGDGLTGLAAGDGAGRFGVWINGAVSVLNSDHENEDFDGNLYMAMLGADYQLLDGLVVGLAAGYEYSDLDTSYNDGNIESTGLTIAPYIGYAILDNLTIDAMFAYTFVDKDTDRANGAVSGDYNADRTMFSVNANYYYLMEQWNFGLNAGYMYTNEAAESYTMSDNTEVSKRDAFVGEWRVGGRVGYFFEKAEPYLALAYLYDHALSGEVHDRDEMEGTLGVNFYPKDSMIFTAEVANSFFREKEQNTRFMLSFRYEF